MSRSELEPLGALSEAVSRWAMNGITLAVAESLTGGLVLAELVSVPGVSAVLRGGVVAYHTGLKQQLLGVDAQLLQEQGPVHPLVAEQMAQGARRLCALEGQAATIGLSTTGVAGPQTQGGQLPGTVFLGLSAPSGTEHLALQLSGDREGIRLESARLALEWLLDRVGPDGDLRAGAGE